MNPSEIEFIGLSDACVHYSLFCIHDIASSHLHGCRNKVPVFYLRQNTVDVPWKQTIQPVQASPHYLQKRKR